MCSTAIVKFKLLSSKFLVSFFTKLRLFKKTSCGEMLFLFTSSLLIALIELFFNFLNSRLSIFIYAFNDFLNFCISCFIEFIQRIYIGLARFKAPVDAVCDRAVFNVFCGDGLDLLVDAALEHVFHVFVLINFGEKTFSLCL